MQADGTCPGGGNGSPGSEALPRIGIALSGGGSRAMAFHLGCLRSLDGIGLLEKARVLSTVSGGSVIGAMYAVHEGDFPSFERRVRSVLRVGFVKPAIRVAFTTAEGWKAVACFGLLLAAWLWLLPFQASAFFARAFGGSREGDAPAGRERWLPRRFSSRTTILRRAFDDGLFHGKTLGNLRWDGPRLVVIAAELRTGSAFYFGRAEAGSWRFGKMDPAKVPVAQAVAASAAYPLLLPALDEHFVFRRRDGSIATERVALADGGSYDNLGLSPLWPGRHREVSISFEEVDTIIACRAGYGLRMGNPRLFAPARIAAAFACLHNRAQNSSMTRLFELKASGSLRNFVLPYIDQDDEKLACAPPDLVKRAEVAGYRTDFSAMPEEWIERLSKRGEQLTLALLREHTPELLGTHVFAAEPKVS